MAAPLMVSNARSEMMAKVFMPRSSLPIVAEKVSSWSKFKTIPGIIVLTRGSPSPESSVGKQH